MAQSVGTRSTQHSQVSHTVVSAVAELTDSDPIDLDPLFTAVDSDALDALFGANGDASGGLERVEFRYSGCRVVVTGDGTVRASRADREISKRWT